MKEKRRRFGVRIVIADEGGARRLSQLNRATRLHFVCVKSLYSPIARLLKAAIEQAYLGEENCIQEWHLDHLLQVEFDAELVLLLLHHECHAGRTRPEQCH
jgi:hypothetical protein